MPSRNSGSTLDFYGRLGFAETWRDDGWMILVRDGAQLEFFPHPDIDPAASWFSACLRLDEVAGFHRVCLAAGVPEAARGWPRLHPLRIEASGLAIGALVYADGSLVRLFQN